ncbi:MAG TPA: 50S ribosomal protein L9 [Gemmatimonadales bacterium]|nr:50S ribosomal protein L9 [Gemmatimonadales bacterium]
MEVILRQDVPSLGKAGQVVKVKDGYARNFLFPKSLAYEATDGNKKRIASEQAAMAAKRAAEKQEAEALAARLGALTVTITAKAGDEGKLFGSIGGNDIAVALEKLGHAVDKRRIDLEHPLKAVGEYTVPLKLHADVTARIRVTIQPA